MAQRQEKKRKEHVVGDVSDFPEGSHKVVKVGRREIGVFNIRGELYGLPNLCPHQKGPLCEGKPAVGPLSGSADGGWKIEWVHDGQIVACPWHGLEYHVPTGGCIAYPNVSLRSYEVVAENGKVKVRI